MKDFPGCKTSVYQKSGSKIKSAVTFEAGAHDLCCAMALSGISATAELWHLVSVPLITVNSSIGQ